MSEENYAFKKGDRVIYLGVWAKKIQGEVLGPVPSIGNFYFVDSHEGEVKIFAGSALTRK